jgi:hypothetical protein
MHGERSGYAWVVFGSLYSLNVYVASIFHLSTLDFQLLQLEQGRMKEEL